MGIVHNGFTFRCDVNRFVEVCVTFNAEAARTRKTAVRHARAMGWAIVRLRITSGGVAPSINLVMCPRCKWLVGL